MTATCAVDRALVTATPAGTVTDDRARVTVGDAPGNFTASARHARPNVECVECATVSRSRERRRSKDRDRSKERDRRDKDKKSRDRSRSPRDRDSRRDRDRHRGGGGDANHDASDNGTAELKQEHEQIENGQQ